MNFDKYQTYAKAVLNGEIVAGNYVKLACKRYLDFFDKYEFRADIVDKIINFISKLRHWQGKHNGQPFKLLPYQEWMTYAIFGFYIPGTDRRVVNYAYIELARKNGKTALVSAWLDFLLVAAGEGGAEIDMIANSAKQAQICFNMSSNFLGSIDKKNKYFKRYRDKIKFDTTKSFMQVLSSDTSKLDGGNPSAFCLDEVHEQKDSKAFDVMVSGQGSRENPLGLLITTAGFNKFGFCYPYRQSCINVLHRLAENDSQFIAIYTLDDGDDWANPDVWIKANPSLGVTVFPQYLEQQVRNAKTNTALEVGVRTKNFNQWVSSQDIWLSNDLLLSCSKDVKLEDYKDSFCYMGVDLASVSDLTALSLVIPFDDKFIFKTYYYLPASCLHDNSNSELYKEWKRKGLLTITNGNVTDYDYVLNDILKINKILYISKIGYDSYNATQWAINATEQNLPLEPYSQALWSFNRPTKEIERLIKMGKVIIDNNEITRWCFSNVTLKFDHNDNCKPVKEENQQKIDGVIAMIEALGMYLTVPHYDNSID